MGQSTSAPKATNDVAEFLNFPKEALENLWTSYNLLGEGWGLSQGELTAIFNGADFLVANYGFSDEQLQRLFKAFDTDINGLVDALELFVAIALASGMDAVEKIDFCFNAFDFDSVGTLSFDETNLLLRSVVKGLGKVSPTSLVFTTPTSTLIERYARLMFEHAAKNPDSEDRISLADCRLYCTVHPVISSWLKSVALYASPQQSNSTANAEYKCGDVTTIQPTPWASNLVRKAKRPAETAAVLPEVDFAAIVAAKKAAAEAAEALRNKKPVGGEDGEEEEAGDDPEDEAKTAEKAAAAAAAEEAAKAAAALLPDWVHAVDLMKPEEMPEGIRSDLPEDAFEPVWISGLNTTRLLPPPPPKQAGEELADDNGDSPLMHRCVRYGAAPPAPAASEGDTEEGTAVAAPTPFIGTAANHVFQMVKSPEEGVGWSQQLFTEHRGASINCLDVHHAKNLLVTGDSVGSVVLWALDSFAVKWTLQMEVGVKLLDISADGSLLLVVSLDANSTATMFDIHGLVSTQSPAVVFSKPLLQGVRVMEDAVLDARFSGTTAMFAAAFSKQELTFYVEEAGGVAGNNGWRKYEEHYGLYQTTGSAAVNVPMTEICRFNEADEMVTGSSKGQVLLWHGRSCAQLIEAHEAPVTALDFNRANLTLLTAAADGTVSMFKLAALAAGASSPSKRGPQILQPRLLELTATFDIMTHDLCSYSIRSVSIAEDCTKALISTSGAEVVEVALAVTPFSAEEMAELEAAAAEAAEAAAAAAAEAAEAAAAAAAAAANEDEEGGGGGGASDEVSVTVEPLPPIPTNKVNIGDDVQGGPIISCHYNSAPGATASLSSVCRMPAGGFVTCAADGTVRWWQGSGGSEETGAAVYKASNTLKMDSGCSVVDSSATNLAVALDGTGANPARKGSVHLFSVPEMQFVTELADVKSNISDLKFSPEGNLLAAASKDGSIYVYQSTEGVWSLKGPVGASYADGTAFPAKIDFSADGMYLRAYYPAAAKFHVWDVSGTFGKDITDRSAEQPPPTIDPDTGEEIPAEPVGPPLDVLRGLSWASNSCAHNWDTKGASFVHTALSTATPQSQTSGGAFFSAADRFNHLLLTAMSSGAVNVHRVPALNYTTSSTPATVSFEAHLGAVSSLAFIEEGARLVTVGASDGLLRVWKAIYDTDEFEPDPEPTPPAAEGSEEAVEEEEGEEGEEGKPKLPVLYDSGEDDDLLDGPRAKEHLSRHCIKKRFALLREKGLNAKADAKAKAEAAAAAAAALAAAVEAGEEVPAAAEDEAASQSADDDSSTVKVDLYGPDVTQVDKYSGLKFWAPSLGLRVDNMSSESTRALVAPPGVVPNDELRVDWVYGCSTRQTRNAVHYTTDGAIVYPAGTMGVVYDKVQHKQTIAMPHFDEITCLDVHVVSGLAVSAHKGVGNIEACVWSVRDGSVRKVLDCGEVGSVAAVKFSPDASLVAVCCQDKDHTVMLFSVSDGHLRAKHHSGPKKPLCIAFSLAPVTVTAPMRLLQGGVLHFKFLTFFAGRGDLVGKNGGYGGDVKKSNAICVGALPVQVSSEGEVSGNEFVLGMSDGTMGLISRGETKCAGFSPVHKGAITALYVAKLKDGTAEEPPVFKIITGGVDATIKVLDSELQPLQEFNLYLPDRGLQPLGRLRGFKSVCVDKLNRKILYGTAGGEIGEIDIEKGTEVNEGVGPLVNSHFRDELHALCAHPLRDECITAGDDKTLRVWHLDEKRMATSIELPDIARCATLSPNGLLVAAGLGGVVSGDARNPREHNGKVVILSYLQGELRIVHMTTDAKDSVTCVLFTPDGSKLIAGSLDGSIYIYDALNNFQLVITLTGHKEEGIKHMDISENGQYLTSSGQRKELIVWDLTTGAKIESPDGRFEALATVGLEWNVRQSPFGLTSIGVFPAFSDSADTLSVDQSKDAKLLAAGDEFGALKLFRNPSCDYFAPYKQYFAHSPGGVSKVAFTMEDKYVLSAGRTDRVIVQWTVTKSSEQPDRRMGHAVSAVLAAQKLGSAGGAVVADMDDLVSAVVAAQKLAGGGGDEAVGDTPAAVSAAPAALDMDAVMSALLASKRLAVSEGADEDDVDPTAVPEVDFEDVMSAVIAAQKLSSAPGSTAAANGLSDLVGSIMLAQKLGADNEPVLGDLDDVVSTIVVAQRLGAAPAPHVRFLDDLPTAVVAASKPGVEASSAINEISDIVSAISAVQKLGVAPESQDASVPDFEELVAATLAAQKLSAEDEDDFAASFTIKGVNMAASSGVPNFQDKAELKVQLQSVIGMGFDATSAPTQGSSSQLPCALLFGQGDILTCAGKVPMLLEGGVSGVQRPMWFPSPTSNPGISHYNNPQQEQLSTFTVSNSGKYALLGHWNVRSGGGRLVAIRAPAGVVVTELAAFVTGGVRAVAFSEDDSTCGCIGGDSQHSIQIFRSVNGQWDDATLIASAQTSAANINMLAFIPRQSVPPVARKTEAIAATEAEVLDVDGEEAPAAETAAETAVESSAPATATAAADTTEKVATAASAPQFDLVTAGGTGHIKFWTIAGRNLHCVCGEYQEGLTKPALTAMAACTGGVVVTGDAEGMLHVWGQSGRKQQKLEAHNYVVTALKAFSSGLVSASSDKVIIWNVDAAASAEGSFLAVKNSISVPSILSTGCGWTAAIYLSDRLAAHNFVTAIDCDPQCQRLLLSFSTSALVSVAVDSANSRKILEGHPVSKPRSSGASGKVLGMVPHPTEPATVLTFAEDHTLRLWDVSTVTVEGSYKSADPMQLVCALQLSHPPTAAAFLNGSVLLVAVSGADNDGKSGAILVVHIEKQRSTIMGQEMLFSMTIVGKIHNVGTGEIQSLRIAPQEKYVAACSADGCAYIYTVNAAALNAEIDAAAAGGGGMAEEKSSGSSGSSSDSSSSAGTAKAFPPMGFLLAHPSGSPVAALDFSVDCRYARTFGINRASSNGKVEVNFFDFELNANSANDGGSDTGSNDGKAAAAPGRGMHAAGKVQEAFQIEAIRDNTRWASIGSGAAPEARALSYAAGEKSKLRNVVNVTKNSSQGLVCASYKDGSIKICRAPADHPGSFATSKSAADVLVHAYGPALCTFTATEDGSNKLVTVSQVDGTMMVWKISE